MQILFGLFGLALLVGLGKTVMSEIHRRRSVDHFEGPPTDPRFDYARSNVLKYTSLSHPPKQDEPTRDHHD